ncbi:MAG: hypothetical protein WC071_11765 [Victivallaceae bacterium]
MKYRIYPVLKDSFLFLMIIYVIIELQFGFSKFYIIRESPSSRTNYILNVVARTIEESVAAPPEHSSREELRKWIRNNGLNNFLPNPEWRPEKYFASKNNTCDFFGNPLHIDYTGNFPQNISAHKFKKLKYNLVVWSSGPNGINEWGEGDDVVYK